MDHRIHCSVFSMDGEDIMVTYETMAKVAVIFNFNTFYEKDFTWPTLLTIRITSCT